MEQFFTKKENAPKPIVLSLEEEAILMSEIQDQMNEDQNNAHAIARVEDIQQGANDVVEILASASEIGDVEKQLIESVSDMASAGTDIDTTELFCTKPVTNEISVEGFKSNVDKYITDVKNQFPEVAEKALSRYKKV